MLKLVQADIKFNVRIVPHVRRIRKADAPQTNHQY